MFIILLKIMNTQTIGRIYNNSSFMHPYISHLKMINKDKFIVLHMINENTTNIIFESNDEDIYEFKYQFLSDEYPYTNLIIFKQNVKIFNYKIKYIQQYIIKTNKSDNFVITKDIFTDH